MTDAEKIRKAATAVADNAERIVKAIELGHQYRHFELNIKRHPDEEIQVDFGVYDAQSDLSTQHSQDFDEAYQLWLDQYATAAKLTADKMIASLLKAMDE